MQQETLRDNLPGNAGRDAVLSVGAFWRFGGVL